VLFRSNGSGLAGHNNAGGISVDGKDLNNGGLFTGSPYPKTDAAWQKATPQERCDAVIIHENTERVNGVNHEAAIRKSPAEGKKQGVSQNSQDILDAMNDESVGV
ncbi:MAG: hypothetical protein AB7F89_21720, partial [Pirellulaceae bacterium]